MNSDVRPTHGRAVGLVAGFLAGCVALAAPALTFSASADTAPVTDATAPPDPVAALAIELDSQGAPLTFSPATGYLTDLLQRLNVGEDSQVLVFSRTSLQSPDVTPASPRAIFFNDRVSVGYIPGAHLIELWAVGADGTIRFYTLENEAGPGAQFRDDDPRCAICHGSRNPAAPGPVTMSVATRPDGEVSNYAPGFTSGRTPISERWGGWYVTGQHGEMRHRGNAFVEAGSVVGDAGQNLISLAGRFEGARYSRQTSDIVALMTLEHQTGFLNYAAAIQALATVDYDQAAMESAVEDLADYMLGVDQAVLSAEVIGVSGFTERFQAQGPRDEDGRSLRDFDLRTRLFRYPLSYMIYSPAFDGLPAEPRAMLYRRLADVLSGRDQSDKYRGIPDADRTAALEILSETKSDLPSFWPVAAPFGVALYGQAAH